jgi:hypothetical protein
MFYDKKESKKNIPVREKTNSEASLNAKHVQLSKKR